MKEILLTEKEMVFLVLLYFHGQSLFFDKVEKKRLWHRCFPVNFVKFLRTSLLQNTSGHLLLNCEIEKM